MAPTGGNAAPANTGGQGGGQQGGQAEDGGMSWWMRALWQMAMIAMIMNLFGGNKRAHINATLHNATNNTSRDGAEQPLPQVQMRNLFGQVEECDLFVHVSMHSQVPPLEAIVNHSAEKSGWQLLWQTRVWYEANAAPSSVNITLNPLPAEVLSGEAFQYIHALLVRTELLQDDAVVSQIPAEQIITQSIPLQTKMRELDGEAGAVNLFGDDQGLTPLQHRNSSVKVPYLKTKLEVRLVHDHTIHTSMSTNQGPFKRIRLHPKLGVYEPYLYLSDFWLLEKDYVPLNETLAGQRLNLTLSYSTIGIMAWSMQAQMAEQWMTQGEWGLTDTQRDSFMLKRLITDTNPYLLAFSGAFIVLHMLFSMLAFKNDIQFWRNNESMQGLSARSMVVSFICQGITALYLLDSQETSRLILFEILLDLSLATWKLRKAVNIQLKRSFPFFSLTGQAGYEDKGTSKYDDEAVRYMMALLTPLFIGYTVRSALYGKHRSWYSFLVNAAAGGVYTFGFVLMTPQLYINYKLQSVEHLPWRALTYKAMNTFVDDVAAFLIDMPMMHRLSCFRDDIIFFIYIYQRWKYSVDKTRPTMWTSPEQNAIDGAGERAAMLQAPNDMPPSNVSESAACTAVGGGAACAAPSATNTEVRQRK